LDIHRSKKQTAHNLCELLLLVFEDIQHRNPIVAIFAMEFVRGGASRAEKYHGFAPPALKKITNKIWGEKT
jgi:hypothetical protein